jgi:hypothetical protein
MKGDETRQTPGGQWEKTRPKTQKARVGMESAAREIAACSGTFLAGRTSKDFPI